MTRRVVEACPRCTSQHVDITPPPQRRGSPVISGVYTGLGLLALTVALGGNTGAVFGLVLAVCCVVAGVVGEVLAACDVWLRCQDCKLHWAVASWQLPRADKIGNPP